MQDSFNIGNMPVSTTTHPLQQHQQQQLSPEHHQHQQQNLNYPQQTYPGTQTYDGWPGMALKQIMGQIDLINFQNQNSTGQAKWPTNKDLMNNSNQNSYIQMQTAASMQQQQQQQQQHQHEAYKSHVAYENAQQIDGDNAMAWLGPQLWNRRIGVDVSNGGTHQIAASNHAAMYNDMKIKTEMGGTSDGDSNNTWYNNNNNNMDDRSSSDNNSTCQVRV